MFVYLQQLLTPVVSNVLHLKSLSRSDAGAILECRADNGGNGGAVVSTVVVDMIREWENGALFSRRRKVRSH